MTREDYQNHTDAQIEMINFYTIIAYLYVFTFYLFFFIFLWIVRQYTRLINRIIIASAMRRAFNNYDYSRSSETQRNFSYELSELSQSDVYVKMEPEECEIEDCVICYSALD